MSEAMAPSKRMIERQFDGSAQAYDRMGPSVFGRFGARLVEQVSLAQDARVLDVATGTGAALLPACLSKVLRSAWLVLLPIAAAYLHRALNPVADSAAINAAL